MFDLYHALNQQQEMIDHLTHGDDWLRVFNAATDAGHDIEKANDLAGEFVLGSVGN